MDGRAERRITNIVVVIIIIIFHLKSSDDDRVANEELDESFDMCRHISKIWLKQDKILWQISSVKLYPLLEKKNISYDN